MPDATPAAPAAAPAAPPAAPPQATPPVRRTAAERIAAATEAAKTAKVAETKGSEGPPDKPAEAPAAPAPESKPAEAAKPEEKVPEPPKTASALLADIQELARARRPVPVRAAPPPAPAAEPPKPETPAAPEADLGESIYAVAKRTHRTPYEVLQSYVNELKGGKPIPLHSSLSPALTEVQKLREENEALRKQVEEGTTEIRQTVDERFQALERQQEAERQAAQVRGAANFLQQPERAKRLPYIAANIAANGPVAMAERLAEVARLAATSPQHRHLTPDQLADMVEADLRKEYAPYAKLQKSVEAQSPPVQLKTEPTTPGAAVSTLPPTVTPTDGKAPKKRRTEKERLNAAADAARKARTA